MREGGREGGREGRRGGREGWGGGREGGKPYLHSQSSWPKFPSTIYYLKGGGGGGGRGGRGGRGGGGGGGSRQHYKCSPYTYYVRVGYEAKIDGNISSLCEIASC